MAPGDVSHRWPQVLPGAEAVLFTAAPTAVGHENDSIEVMSLKTGQVQVLERGGYYGRYLPSGHIVYIRQGVLFAVPFDVRKLEVLGSPTPVFDDLGGSPTTGGGQFDFSIAGPGTLVYLAGKGTAQAWQVSWLESSGKMQPLVEAPGDYYQLHFSPDGRKLAFGSGSDIYVYDMDRRVTTRLTFTGNAQIPIWTPDGKHIVYRTISETSSIDWIRGDGGGEPQRLLSRPLNPAPWSFSADGRRLAFFETFAETGQDILTLTLDTADPEHPRVSTPEPFLSTPVDESIPSFSPDGRWIAYRSNEQGSNEIYVRPFPSGKGGKWQISSGGALYAIWAKNGRELFYETADNRIMVVDYAVNGDSFLPGTPRPWSDKQIFYPGALNLALAPDGKRFAVLSLPEITTQDKTAVHVMMVQNIFDELKRRIPVK